MSSYNYNFALEPEVAMPTGCANFSRIDTPSVFFDSSALFGKSKPPIKKTAKSLQYLAAQKLKHRAVDLREELAGSHILKVLESEWYNSLVQFSVYHNVLHVMSYLSYSA